jgi:outer membrane protein assembly factor BamB
MPVRILDFTLAFVFLFTTVVTGEENWPQWRGPTGTGFAPSANPPVEWSEKENIRWKIATPGIGHSTPIVWGNHIFLTAALPVGDSRKPRFSGAPGAHDNLPVSRRHQFIALAIDRKDGTLLWQTELSEEWPHEGGHYSGSLASASPVTDGESLFAFFGSYGLYCLDFDGNVQWQADLGKMNSKHGHGEGSSPALFGDKLVVNWDHEGQSFLVAFDKRSGAELWKVLRNEVTSWATPLIVEYGGRAQVIVVGTDRVRGYELESGEVIWQCGGMSANIVASPVFADGMLFAGSSYEKRALLAISLQGARGDITQTDNVVWSRFRGTPYVPSPLLYDGKLYFLTHYQGILSRVDAATGKDRPGAERLPGIRNVYASPVGAGGRVYITDLDGTTAVMSHADHFRPVAVNRLEDNFSASAAVVGDEIFLRGRKYLYCIAEQ